MSGIQRDRSNKIQCGMDHLLRSLNFLKCSKSRCAHELTVAVSFSYINVSQSSVAMQFRCGGIIHNHFIANFPQSVPVKEFFKSVNIWRRYGQKCGVMFFLTHGVHFQLHCHQTEVKQQQHLRQSHQSHQQRPQHPQQQQGQQLPQHPQQQQGQQLPQ